MLDPMSIREERIRIVEPDPKWPERFAEERRRLESVLAPWLDGGVHHVGSTAVPGLAAKPTIDILAGVTSLEASRPAIPILEQEGWAYFPYRPEEMLWFCKPSPQRRDFHLHLVPTTAERFLDELAFRDALHADHDLASAYALLKRELAARYADDREGYTQAKVGFITDVPRTRREIRGSP
jgi:GrpB-like predicted nucleotidyltransferase (UPF0157 family)